MKKVITHNFNTVNVLSSFFSLFTFEFNHVLSFPGSACYYAEVLGLLVQDFLSIIIIFFLCFGLFIFRPTDRQTQNQGTHSTVNKKIALAGVHVVSAIVSKDFSMGIGA